MTRTKLCDREFVDYIRGEEIFNTVSHSVGALFGIFALVSCLYVSVRYGDVWSIVSSAIYGGSLILLYTMSSVYHGLPKNTAKKVMQVLDHCTIYVLIAGTYTPVVLCPIRSYSPAWGWSIFGFVWGCAIIGGVFTAIDWKKYEKFAMACYLGMGWCIVIAADVAIKSVPMPGLVWMLMGGVSYTVGAVAYGLGNKRRYMHSVFHLFVLLGSILQYVSIVKYML